MTGILAHGSTAVGCDSMSRGLLARWRILAIAAAALAISVAAPARPSMAAPMDGTSSAEAREDATRKIPWSRLPEGQRRDVEYVVKNPSIYRRLPTRVVDCDPDLFTFLLRRPD